jgi:hypothetical protein
MQRAHDRHQSAYRFGELIDKHGDENWLEPLMQGMGPHLQLQLSDIGNMLEVFVKSVMHHKYRLISLTKPETAFTIGCLRERPLLPSGSSLHAFYSRCSAIWRFASRSLDS